MTATVKNGVLVGTLKDDKGVAWPVKAHLQTSARGAMATNRPNLCLHTTETDGYVTVLQFPSNFQTGDGVIGQHIRLGMAGDAVFDHDNVLMQIEMVGRSQQAKWLPKESTLGPTVALVAWLHRTGRIKTGTARPNADWPVVLDKGPQAVESYYRRNDGTWDAKGIYGHVEIPGNNHWDPGSFDYPAFIERVRKAIDVQTADTYVVGDRKFHRLARALDYVKRLLRRGKDAVVKIVKRG